MIEKAQSLLTSTPIHTVTSKGALDTFPSHPLK